MPKLTNAFCCRAQSSIGARLSLAFSLVAMAGLAGCGTTSSGGGLDKALEVVGLQRPAPAMPEKLPQANAPGARKVTLRLHAGDILNTSSDGRSLSVVARIYKLRDHTAFDRLSYDTLQDAATPGNAEWAREVVEVKEVVLTPGQRYEAVETVPPEAAYVAVAALFRAPAPQRWRFVFDSRAAERSGVTLGLHGCAISVAAGQALGVAPEMTRLAGVRCR